jgi:uncharacterized protein Yka (UPF0111/DUF47 family)
MISLKRILGQDDKFYDLLESSADEAKNSATLLVKLLPKISDVDSVAELEQSRRRHKRITTEITKQLCQNFVTPLEREDIEALSTALYKIPKNIEKIGETLTMRPLPIEKVASQVKLLEHATQAVAVMVRALRQKPHVEDISETYAKLQAIEGEADKLITARLRELYQGDFDIKDFALLKDLYELLEKVIDRCRDAGNVVFQVVLKYS